jgi:hypothetical protein
MHTKRKKQHIHSRTYMNYHKATCFAFKVGVGKKSCNVAT